MSIINCSVASFSFSLEQWKQYENSWNWGREEKDKVTIAGIFKSALKEKCAKMDDKQKSEFIKKFTDISAPDYGTEEGFARVFKEATKDI